MLDRIYFKRKSKWWHDAADLDNEQSTRLGIFGYLPPEIRERIWLNLIDVSEAEYSELYVWAGSGRRLRARRGGNDPFQSGKQLERRASSSQSEMKKLRTVSRVSTPRAVSSTISQ